MSYKLSKSELKEIKTNLYNISIQQFLDLIEKYLRELINQYKHEGEWKVQLSAEINFISLKPGSDETRLMYTRSDNEEFMSGSDTDEVIKLLFRSFLQKCQENLHNKMRGSNFEFDGVSYYYRADDCMEKFCKDLREYSMKIINYEKKRMVPLTTKEAICYNKQKICYICKK